MSAVGITVASVLVIHAPTCAGRWEMVPNGQSGWNFFARIDPGVPAMAEVRDEQGRLMTVLRSQTTVYWRCVPYSTGPVS